MWFIPKGHLLQTYGVSVLLGVGGSALLVTALTMLADLIGENVVRVFARWRRCGRTSNRELIDELQLKPAIKNLVF